MAYWLLECQDKSHGKVKSKKAAHKSIFLNMTLPSFTCHNMAAGL